MRSAPTPAPTWARVCWSRRLQRPVQAPYVSMRAMDVDSTRVSPYFPLCLRRPCQFYRNLFALHDACHRGDVDLFRPGAPQRARAFGGGSTGGEHVIHQDDVMPIDL